MGMIRSNKQLMRTLAFTILFATLSCLLPAGGQEAAAAVNLRNPTSSGDTVTWDCIWFGHYPQSSDGSGGFDNEPIKWRVLFAEENEALLLADQNLDARVYNEKETSAVWETSSVRNWLNSSEWDSFLVKAFTGAEQRAICEKTLQNPGNPEGTAGGKETRDKVFLLSIEEVTNPSYGFLRDWEDDSETRRAVNTDYAKSRKAWTSNRLESAGNGWWWLRSPGDDTGYAADVDFDGYVNGCGMDIRHDGFAIRPALRLNLSSNLWNYAGTVSSNGTVNEVGGAPEGRRRMIFMDEFQAWPSGLLFIIKK